MDTIVALSSGRPPAAIGIVRISGPAAFAAATALVGPLPPPRRASLRLAKDLAGASLDRLLVLVFPGTTSTTGEDLVELHCHGGRATIDAVLGALLDHRNVRRAEAGEFTRQALTNGRLDLAQAEGLADLLEAETEAQRRVALSAAEGRTSSAILGWMDTVALLSAQVEALLDFADEDDVTRDLALFAQVRAGAEALAGEMDAVLAAPPVDRIRDGIRVVIAGPPNSGKSTLLNLLAQTEAAIVSPHAGTTRDRIEVPVRRGEIAYRLTDTAGLTSTDDPVEQIGVFRAGQAIMAADLLLWLGDDAPPRSDAIWIHSRADLAGRGELPESRMLATAFDRPWSIDLLWEAIASRATSLLPLPDAMTLSAVQFAHVAEARGFLALNDDMLVSGEQLRLARSALAGIIGLNATEQMLDALFNRFCIGK